MRVLVFGATGKTGRLVCRAALAQDHLVTAFGRSVDQLDDPGLELCKGDALDGGLVTNAVAGHDAVIVCLGSTGLRDRTTLAVGTRHVVDSMITHDVNRLIVLSAAGVGHSWKQIPWTSKLVFRTMLRNIFADHHAQEEIVRQCELNWTIVRAAVLKDGPATGRYNATNTAPTTHITRGDVASFLVAQLTDPSHSRQHISVTS